MKKRTVLLSIMWLLLLLLVTGCGNTTESVEEPEISKIRSICELATLECYYHNVAQSVKQPEKGISHWGEKEREFWVEYDGTVKLGVDMSKVQMSVSNEDITITIPEAKILNVQVNPLTYNEDSYIMSNDGWNSNKITAEDATQAVHEAKLNMEKTAQENTALLINAQNRAKELIENYIKKIGDAAGTKYNITWEYLDNEATKGEEANEEQSTSSESE